MNPKINYENENFFLNLVRSKKLIVNIDGTVFNTKTGKQLGVKPTSKGYHAIGWKVDGKTKHQLIHRLVFLVHGGVLTDEFPLINHIDGNKSNNRFENLEASNYSHNNKHAYDTGLSVWNEEKREIHLDRHSGEKASDAKFTNEEADVIRSMYATGNFTQRELGKMHNVSHVSIGDIVRNHSYIRHKG